jgi:hypothetical protein
MNCAGQAVLAALLVLALAARAHGAEEGAKAPACPGAVARGKAHPQESDRALAERDAARTLTDPRLRAELDERFATDQKARIAWLESRRSRSTGRAVALTDADNVQWLAALVRTHGFPTAAQVGERGVRDAWLLLQHADRAPDFQALLAVLEQRYADGDLPASPTAC